MNIRYEIVHDEDAESPECWHDDEMFLVSLHRQCWITNHDKVTSIEDLQEYRDDDDYIVIPVDAYIHSGVALALTASPEAGRFPDRRWDVSQCAWIVMTKQAVNTFPKQPSTPRELAQGLVDLWNQYLCGDVWGFTVYVDDEDYESVWGIYGEKEAHHYAKCSMENIKAFFEKFPQAIPGGNHRGSWEQDDPETKAQPEVK